MLTKEITYTDYNGMNHTDTYYFNLNKAEIIKLNYKYKGGFDQHIQNIINNNDERGMLELVEDLILMSHGEKSANGIDFIKNDFTKTRFQNSEAYSELFVELISNPDKLTEFVNGIIPAGLMAQLDTIKKKELEGNHT